MTEQRSFKTQIQAWQQQDPAVESVVGYSKFVVVYMLEQSGSNPGWQKANIEGPVYIVQRRSEPRYKLIVKNQFSDYNLTENLHPDWELDCQTNYIFYKVEDPSQRVRGLWFHDDNERQNFETVFRNSIEETPAPQVQQSGPAPVPSSKSEEAQQPAPPVGNSNGGQQKSQTTSPDSVTVSASTVRSSLHALADDDSFLDAIMNKMRLAQR